MNPPIGDSNLDELLMVLNERPLTPEEQAQLTSILLDHPSLQQKYLDYLLMDSLLAWEQPSQELSANSLVESDVSPNEENQLVRRMQYAQRFWMLVLSLAFVIGIGLPL